MISSDSGPSRPKPASEPAPKPYPLLPAPKPAQLRPAAAAAGLIALALLSACARPVETSGSGTPVAKLPPRPHVLAADDIAAGRYLVVLGGCNDCHTRGWDTSGGALAENKWLTGTAVGWNGPWGTTYPSNLRLLVWDMNEDQFVEMLRTRKDRPPMPWMNVNRLHEADARAVYRFIKSLGPTGERMPLATGPGVTPTTAYNALGQPAPKTPARAQAKVGKARMGQEG